MSSAAALDRTLGEEGERYEQAEVPGSSEPSGQSQ